MLLSELDLQTALRLCRKILRVCRECAGADHFHPQNDLGNFRALIRQDCFTVIFYAVLSSFKAGTKDISPKGGIVLRCSRLF